MKKLLFLLVISSTLGLFANENYKQYPLKHSLVTVKSESADNLQLDSIIVNNKNISYSEKYIYVYDSEGNKILERGYEWSSDKNDLVEKTKVISTYYPDDKIESKEVYKCSTPSNVWTGYYKLVFTYTPNGDISSKKE